MVRASFAMRLSPTPTRDGWTLGSIVPLGLQQFSYPTQQIGDGLDRAHGGVGELFDAERCLAFDHGNAKGADLATLAQHFHRSERVRIRFVVA